LLVNQHKLSDPKTPWGSGTIFTWPPIQIDPEEGTVRGAILKAIQAQHFNDPEGEEAAWLSLGRSEEPMWKDAVRWVVQRWAYCAAETSGYLHSEAEVKAHAQGIDGPANDGVSRSEVIDHQGTKILYYEYGNGKWSAFQRAPVIRDEVDGVSVAVQPDLYTQLDNRESILELLPEDGGAPDSEDPPFEPEEPKGKMEEAFPEFPFELTIKSDQSEPAPPPKKKGKKVAMPNPFEFSLDDPDPKPKKKRATKKASTQKKKSPRKKKLQP